MPAAPARRRGRGPGGPVRWALTGAAVAALAGVAGLASVRRRVVVVTVRGWSMAPALAPGARVLVRRTPPGRARPGDVVVARLDTGPGGWAVKRVAAVAGDPWPAGVPGGPPGGRVPAGRLVLLGDNAAVSLDSRELGAVPADRVVGVVRRRLPGGSAGGGPEPGRDLAGLGRAELREEGVRPA